MEINRTRTLPYKTIVISILIVVILIVYSLRNTDVVEIDDEETSVSICQLRAQFDAYDDRVLVSLLATLKMHDFYIGQPVWGSSDTLLYLCEHRLKIGFKQSIIDRELHHVIKNGPITTARYAWTCA